MWVWVGGFVSGWADGWMGVCVITFLLVCVCALIISCDIFQAPVAGSVFSFKLFPVLCACDL